MSNGSNTQRRGNGPKLTDDTDARDDRETKEDKAVAKPLNGRACDQTPNKLADEGERRQERDVKGVDGILVGRDMIGAELPDKALRQGISTPCSA